MKLKEAFLWQPGWHLQAAILVAGAMLVTAISYLHTATGLAYEFHAFFIVPVLAVSWFLGARYGYALAILAAVEWYLADRILAREQFEGRPGIVRNPQKKRLADCSKTKSHLADAKAGFHRPVLFN